MMKRFCMFCLKDMRRQYPGNDPENGPAMFTCGSDNCDMMRDEESDLRRYLDKRTDVNNIYDEALEDNHMYDMYEHDLLMDEVLHAERIAGWDPNP